MRRLVTALAAVMVLVALGSVPAPAAPPTPIQWLDANGNPITVRMGTRGLPANDQDRDRDKVIKADNVIDDTCAAGMADSTAALIDTHAARRGYLYIRVVLAAGLNFPTYIRLAVRVQGCLNAMDDSTNTYNMSPRYFSPVDSIGITNIVAQPTAVAATTTEYIVTIGADYTINSKWDRSHTYILPLSDNSPGGWFWAEYTKVMVRNLTSGMTGGVPRITVSYRGTPL